METKVGTMKNQDWWDSLTREDKELIKKIVIERLKNMPSNVSFSIG